MAIINCNATQQQFARIVTQQTWNTARGEGTESARVKIRKNISQPLKILFSEQWNELCLVETLKLLVKVVRCTQNFGNYSLHVSVHERTKLVHTYGDSLFFRLCKFFLLGFLLRCWCWMLRLMMLWSYSHSSCFNYKDFNNKIFVNRN